MDKLCTVAKLNYSITLQSCSSPCSSRGILCGLLRVLTWQGPQAEMHGSRFFQQEQQSVLQEFRQLRWVTFKRMCGAAFIVDITGTNWLSRRFLPQSMASIPYALPIQVMIL